MYLPAERVIKCKNLKDNTSITFTEKGFTPFILAKADGIYDVTNNVSMSDNTMIDGAIYQGAIAKKRNIVLTLKDIDNYDENRELIDRVFAGGVLGALTVYDGEHEREIEYYVESISSTAKVTSRLTTISLLCPDPHFYDPYSNVLKISEIMDCFEFPHCFIEAGEEFSFMNMNRIGEIQNNEAEEFTGLTILVKARGTVVDPVITKIESQESLKIGYTNKTFTMMAGDVVSITTHTGNKNIQCTRSGLTTDINEYLSEDSVFFQLTRGVNSIGYDADSGSQYLELIISYRSRFMRA